MWYKLHFINNVIIFIYIVILLDKHNHVPIFIKTDNNTKVTGLVTMVTMHSIATPTVLNNQ